MTTKKTGRPGRGRVPNDPLDWVEGVDQTSSEEIATVTQPVADKQENVSAAAVQTQTLIERKQEKTMSETKHIEQSGRCEAIGEIRRVAEAVRSGNLEVRADVSEMKGECAEVAETVNEMLAQILQQQQQQQHYTSILKGVSTCIQLVDKDYNIIYMNPAVEQMFADAESDIRKQLPHFDSKKLLSMNMDAFHKNPGHQRKILSGLKASIQSTIMLGDRTFDLVATPLFDADGERSGAMVEWSDITVWNNLTTVVAGLSEGDLDRPLVNQESCHGVRKALRDSVNLLRDNIKILVEDSNVLSVAAVEGRLTTRADASKHQGDFRKIVEGVNNTLDAVIGPLNVAADYVDNIAKGNIPAKITDSYNGDFNILKNNLNTCIDAVNALVADANTLSVAAVEGRLATRADASQHQGDFRKIVEGVNNTLDAVIGPLNVAADYVDNIAKGAIPAKITDTYNGDFNILKNNLNTCIEAVNALVADANILAAAAVDGKLATRADASKHQGDFRKIVEGVNNTLDAVIGPLNVAADYVDNIAKGAIPAKITDMYNGDFNILKNNLNTCIDAVNGIIDDAASLSQAIVDGQLNIRADASRHQGDYAKIIVAFENAFVGLNNTFYQIVDTVEQVGQSAEQLNAASQNMAANSEEQSSSVEEVTSSLEETDSQVKANTDNANAANQLVMDTSQAANQGQVKMTGMIGAMDAINQSSQDIAKIIKVIDEIAFQTNLLALNAAVEAARAGQHGRGFAVVAQEVRNLAGRSAKAARETADLIEDSSKRVREGVGIANETREALDQIVGNVTKVKDLVAEIAAASTEQSSGVSQINVAMNQVAKAAQEGSQQAEELASSSGELTNVANQMRMEISRFKLRERQHQASGVGLEDISPEMIRQIMAMMRAEQLGQGVAPKAAAPARAKSAKAVLPLDADERGFGGF